MKKEKLNSVFGFLKKLVTNNALLKILSIIAAIIVWMIIINIDDPIREKTFTVKVQTINESAITSVNKVYEIVDGKEAHIKVRAKKSVLDNLKTSDIKATADLSNLSSVNAVSIVPKLKKNVAGDISLECTQVLKVSLEDLISKQISISVVTDGDTADGYTFGGCYTKPETIEVSGGESTVEKISKVKVFLVLNGESDDFTKRLIPVAYDSSDNEIESSSIEFNESRVKVYASVLKTKTVSLKADVSGSVADGYKYLGVVFFPEKVEIAGSKKMLDEVSSITVPVNINGLKSNSDNLTKNINVQNYLENGIFVLEDYANVSQKISIEKMVTKYFEIKKSDIQLKNVGSGYGASISSDDSDTITIQLQGTQSSISKINTTTLAPYIDCDTLKVGEHSIAVALTHDSDVKVISGANVTVKITKKTTTKATETPTSKPTPTQHATPEPTSTDSKDENTADDNTKN